MSIIASKTCAAKSAAKIAPMDKTNDIRTPYFLQKGWRMPF